MPCTSASANSWPQPWVGTQALPDAPSFAFCSGSGYEFSPTGGWQTSARPTTVYVNYTVAATAADSSSVTNRRVYVRIFDTALAVIGTLDVTRAPGTYTDTIALTFGANDINYARVIQGPGLGTWPSDAVTLTYLSTSAMSVCFWTQLVGETEAC